MKEKNVRKHRVEKVSPIEQDVEKISKDEVRKTLKRTKSGKAADNTPVKVCGRV